MVLIFFLLLAYQDFFDKPFVHYLQEKPDLISPKTNDWVEFTSAISVILVAFSCQYNLFPIYSELNEKKPHNHIIIFGQACMFVSALYIGVAIIAMQIFGADCGNYGSVLQLIALEDNGSGFKPWESMVLRLIYIVVVFCHIPFLFFSGKESILIVIDELDRGSISKAIAFKLKHNCSSNA